jgi:enamine deaminase RidA (YjgF/YER057c/UK114 family)
MGADRRIGSGGPWEDVVGYSRAVVAGPFALVSGSTATVDGQVAHPGDAHAQALVAFGVVERALAEAGFSLADVVRTRMYVRHVRDTEAVGRAHAEVFGAIRPAATLLVVAGFVDPAMLVEVEVDAYRA